MAAILALLSNLCPYVEEEEEEEADQMLSSLVVSENTNIVDES